MTPSNAAGLTLVAIPAAIAFVMLALLAMSGRDEPPATEVGDPCAYADHGPRNVFRPCLRPIVCTDCEGCALHCHLTDPGAVAVHLITDGGAQ